MLILFVFMALVAAVAIYFAYLNYAFWGDNGGPGVGGLERTIIFSTISIGVPVFLSGMGLGGFLTANSNIPMRSGKSDG